MYKTNLSLELFEEYEHHGKMVWVRSKLKGSHRDHCLCFTCNKFFPGDKVKNCPIAQELYEFCLKHNTVNPMYECPKFDFLKGSENENSTRDS